MKLRISLPDEDVSFLDEYGARHGIASRSAAVHRAVRLLRSSDLGAAYADAWVGWSSNRDDRAWDAAISDGLI